MRWDLAHHGASHCVLYDNTEYNISYRVMGVAWDPWLTSHAHVRWSAGEFCLFRVPAALGRNQLRCHGTARCSSALISALDGLVLSSSTSHAGLATAPARAPTDALACRAPAPTTRPPIIQAPHCPLAATDARTVLHIHDIQYSPF